MTVAAFTPHLAILADAQRRLWPQFAGAARLGFVLYGGTAVALRIGHRASIDFDFCGNRTVGTRTLAEALPFVQRATILQESPGTLTLLASATESDADRVKVSFFTLADFGRVGQPQRTPDGVLLVASLDDLLATKLKTILQRAEVKDYRDIAVMLRAGADLAKGIGGARALYGAGFPVADALKALVYFGDGDLQALTAEDRSTLLANATAVRDIPTVRLAAPTLT